MPFFFPFLISAVTPEQLQQHFAGCGTVNRVTILTDKWGNPKGYAYLEFAEVSLKFTINDRPCGIVPLTK